MFTIKFSLGVLPALSCIYAGTDMIEHKRLCSGIKNCSYHQSGLCGKVPASCDHQFRSTKSRNGNCAIQRINEECYIGAPSYLSDPEELLVSIQAYYYNVWLAQRAAFKLTFPSPGWKDLKFRYQDLEVKTRTLCRQFFLSNVQLPLTDELMWDCLVFNEDGDNEWKLELTVISSEGKGGNYKFKAPSPHRIHPGVTNLSNWQVFFFVHADHIERSPHLPVTIQLAQQFKNVSYNVSLVKCVDDHNCQNGTIISSILVNGSKISRDSDAASEDSHLTVFLQSPNTPSKYAVTTQIVSPNCTPEGCFISFSPTFEINQSKLGIMICIAFGLFLIFALAFFITLHHRVKENKKMLFALTEKPTTVLLIYLPENQLCLDLVEMFAVFLKDVCYIHPYVIDIDLGNQDPNCWTSELMNKADRLLFLVPGNTSCESSTPIRDHWTYALNYLTGHYFATHQVTNKVATILFPFSADIPWQIANVQRFKLMQDMDMLVTWIHSGTWLDCKFVWGPQIRSPVQSGVITYTLPEIEEAVLNASQITECCNKIMFNGNSEGKNFLNRASVEKNFDHDFIFVDKIQEVKEKIDIQDSSLTSFTFNSIEDLFDPNVPSIGMLPMLGQETNETADEYQSSDKDSDELDNSFYL